MNHVPRELEKCPAVIYHQNGNQIPPAASTGQALAAPGTAAGRVRFLCLAPHPSIPHRVSSELPAGILSLTPHADIPRWFLEPGAGFISGLPGQEPVKSSLPQFREEVQTHCLGAWADDETLWLLLLALLAWGIHEYKILSMSRDLGNPGSAFLSPGAACILILPSSWTHVGHHGATSHAGGWECCKEQEIHESEGGFSCSHFCVDYYLSPGPHHLLFAVSSAGKDKAKLLTLQCSFLIINSVHS